MDLLSMNIMLVAYGMTIFGPTNKIRYIGYIIIIGYTIYTTLIMNKYKKNNDFKIEYY